MVKDKPARIPLESLPLPALEGIISSLLFVDPSQTLSFLTSLGSVLHEATCRVLYRRLRIVLPALVWEVEGCGEGETREEGRERRRWEAVLSNPARYASCVKEILVFPPAHPHACSQGSLASTSLNQGEEDIFLALLQACSQNVERVEWNGVGVWGDAVSQQLLRLPSLVHLSLLPPPLHPSSLATQYLPSAIPRFHMPHPIPQTLRILEMARLSPMGAKNFASHIINLPGHAPLDKVSVDSALFDDQLAENLSEAGRGIKELWIRTTGTKLTDKGLLQLFEGIPELERLTLSEVQGRFSKYMWTKIDWPETFKHLRVEIADVGPHHSWSLDHILSIPSIQLSNLQTLCITRNTPPFSLFPAPPLGHEPPPPDDVCAAKPIPEVLFNRLLEEGTGLRILEIDWWEVTPEQVSKLAKTLVNLEKFKFTLDAPFTKLLLLTTPFSSLVRLHTLHVIIPTEHLPLPSAAPTSSSIPLHTPSSSPTISKSALREMPSTTTANPSPPVSLSDLHGSSEEELHPVLLAKSTDPNIPLLRDVRKFLRRVPRLVELGWVGRGGIGLWIASRDPEQPSSGLAESASSTIGRGRRSSSGAGTIVAAAGLKGVVDIEFVSFAVKWKDDWAEAAKGFPAWHFESGGAVSPAREMREFVATSPRWTTGGGALPSTTTTERGGHESRQGSTASDRKRQTSMSSVGSFDGTSSNGTDNGGGVLRLDLGPAEEGHSPDNDAGPVSVSPTASRPRSSPSVSSPDPINNVRAPPTSSVSGSNIVQPRIPAKFLPPQPPSTRRTPSSSGSSALPTVISSAELNVEDLSASSAPASQPIAPALLSYRDRAARSGASTNSTTANPIPAEQPQQTQTTGKQQRGGKKIAIPLGTPPAPLTSPPVATTQRSIIGGGTHHAEKRASESNAGGVSGGGSGKKVVNSNGWKTQATGKKGGGGGGVGGKKK